jgi:hypothetical protein
VTAQEEIHSTPCPLCCMPSCTCTKWEQYYGLLRDAVADAFNPPDEDVAEIDIFISAIEAAATYIAWLPCICVDPDDHPCERCLVLGRVADQRADR